MLAMSILVFAAVLALIFLEGGRKMAEEKKGSNIVQIRLSDKQKEELQKRADSVGLPLTQYIIYLITKDLKRE